MRYRMEHERVNLGRWFYKNKQKQLHPLLIAIYVLTWSQVWDCTKRLRGGLIRFINLGTSKSIGEDNILIFFVWAKAKWLMVAVRRKWTAFWNKKMDLQLHLQCFLVSFPSVSIKVYERSHHPEVIDNRATCSLNVSACHEGSFHSRDADTMTPTAFSHICIEVKPLCRPQSSPSYCVMTACTRAVAIS